MDNSFLKVAREWDAFKRSGGKLSADHREAISGHLRHIAAQIEENMSLTDALHKVLPRSEISQLTWLIDQIKTSAPSLGSSMRTIWASVRRERFPNALPPLTSNSPYSQATRWAAKCDTESLQMVIAYCNRLLKERKVSGREHR